MTVSVASISIAPVKGLGLVHPAEVELGLDGVRGNRRFHLIDGDGRLCNGKHLGELVLVAAAHDEAAGTLELRFPNGGVVAGEVSLGASVVTVFYGRPVPGRLVVGPWSEALSAWAGRELELVQPDVAGEGNDRGREAGVSLISGASLDRLAAEAGLVRRVDHRRFRMLLELEGAEANEEDGWLGRRIRIGDALIVPRGNVGRCVVTTRNPDTGESDLDTLGLLAGYRGETPTTEPLPLGIWAQVVEPGRVRVGDRLELDDEPAS